MVFKLIIDFLHFIGKVFDASGFPVITSYLRFTKSESKWTRNPVVSLFECRLLIAEIWRQAEMTYYSP